MSRKRGVQAARNAPSEDRKCWQRIELGIHGLKNWGRNWCRKVRETRSSRRPSRSRRRKRPGSVVGPQRPRGHCSPAPRPMPPAGNRLRFACSIPPLFVLCHSLPRVNTMGKLALFGRFSITFVSTSSISPATGYWPLATVLMPLTAARHTPLPPDSLATVLPPSASPARSGRAQALPRWLLPSTDRRIGNDRTGPDLDDRPLSIFSMSPNRAIPSDKFNFCSPLAAAQPLTVLSWLGALNASGTRHACRMASGCNARAPCLEPLRLPSIVPQVEPLAPNPSLLIPRSSMAGRPLSTDDG